MAGFGCPPRPGSLFQNFIGSRRTAHKWGGQADSGTQFPRQKGKVFRYEPYGSPITKVHSDALSKFDLVYLELPAYHWP